MPAKWIRAVRRFVSSRNQTNIKQLLIKVYYLLYSEDNKSRTAVIIQYSFYTAVKTLRPWPVLRCDTAQWPYRRNLSKGVNPDWDQLLRNGSCAQDQLLSFVKYIKSKASEETKANIRHEQNPLSVLTTRNRHSRFKLKLQHERPTALVFQELF